MSHSIEVDASDHLVSAVTVYQQRAEVVRNISLELEEGQSEVQITHLPTCMDESSLRVDGLGNAIIFDVVFERLSPSQNPPKESSERIEALLKEQASLRRLLKVHSTQQTVLDEFSKSVRAKDVSNTQLVEFLEILQDRGGALADRGDELQRRLEEVGREIAREKKGQLPSEQARKLATKVTVVVLAEKAGRAELTVTYVVSNADWEPLYDLRATVDSPSDSKAEPTTSISLNYRASITQTTGEDWTDVPLILSTSSPLTGTDIPVLSTQRIGPVPKPGGLFGQPVARAKMVSPQALFGQPAPAPVYPMSFAAAAVVPPPPGGGSGVFAELDSLPNIEQPYIEPEPPRLMAPRRTEAREGAISTSFHIEGLSNVPSDTAAHKVAIGLLELSAKLEWIAVPRLNTSAFLQCQITNTSTYVLLPGPSNIFLDGSFVSKSTLPYAPPQDTFSCSVGVDPSVRITYPPISKRVRTQAQGNIFSATKLDVTLFTQRVGVKNTRGREVRLLVRDLVPVSEDQKFKVSVLEPKGLGEAKTGEEVRINKDVYCYWARKDFDTSGDKLGSVAGSGSAGKAMVHKSSQADVPDGQVEWVLSLSPGKEVELGLAWEVAGPAGEKWQVR